MWALPERERDQKAAFSPLSHDGMNTRENYSEYTHTHGRIDQMENMVTASAGRREKISGRCDILPKGGGKEGPP